jgi:hypothetical protein
MRLRNEGRRRGEEREQRKDRRKGKEREQNVYFCAGSIPC